MAIIEVSQQMSSKHSTIQSAVQAASPGDIVEVEKGIYTEDVTIEKPLVLRSSGEETGDVCLTGSMRIAADGNVEIESMTIGVGLSPADAALHVESGQVLLERCLFSEIQGTSLRVGPSAKVSAKHTNFNKNTGGIEVSGRLALFDCIAEATVETAQIIVRDTGEIAVTDCGILSGEEEGVRLSDGSRAAITKSSLIGNRGPHICSEKGSHLDLESTNFFFGQDRGIVCDQSKGVLKNCNFKNQNGAHVELANGSHIEIESGTFENGESEGIIIGGSTAEMTDSLFKGQKGDQIYCSGQSKVSIERTQFLSGAAKGIVCVNSVCTVIESEMKYNQMTQLSAFDQSVLTILGCEIEKGKNKGVYAAESQVKISDSLISHHSSAQVFASEHSELTLSACEVKSGGGVGISAKESEIEAANCLISGHKGSNILLHTAAKADIADCRISDGEKNGVLGGAGTRILLERTVLFHHKRAQVSAAEASEVFVKECEIYDGSASGLWLSETARIAVADTKVHGHRDDQIVLLECPEAVFTSTDVMNGAKAGLRLESSVPVLEDCRFDHHRGGDLVRQDASEPVLKNTQLTISSVSGKSRKKWTSAGASSDSTETMGVLLNELNEYIGLEDVKDKIHDIKNLMEINQFKKERGLKTIEMAAPHMIFQGNPGTGKTTVARLMGGIFKELGLLEIGHLVEVKREDLVGTHVGKSEEQTLLKIKEALGGVLFIDEAYSLVAEGASSKDYGRKVIETLLPAMENFRGVFVVIAAGYTEDMDRFLTSNPGLKDRFTDKINFQDYTPDELLEIFLSQCEGSYSLTPAAKQAVYEEFVERYRTRDQTFSNARMARTLYDQIGLAQSMRIAKLPRNQWTETLLTTFEEEDVRQAVQEREVKRYEVPINEELLALKRAELHRFIGLGSVKAEIDEMIELMRYYKRENYSTDKLLNHTLLIGKPGTGKTEVGRVLAGIYQALGLLERGDLIEVDRSDLVGTHIGETEKRTADQIERAMGSALFIDEAYTLAGGGENDYGKKAIEVLLKQMSDRQGEFLLIAAGYEKEMNKFLDSNAGLRRRFGLTLHFEDYTPEELMEITALYITGYSMTEDAKDVLYHHYQDLYARRGHDFGNAGLAKKMAKEMTRKVDYRLAVASSSPANPVLKKEIMAEDLVLLEN